MEPWPWPDFRESLSKSYGIRPKGRKSQKVTVLLRLLRAAPRAARAEGSTRPKSTYRYIFVCARTAHAVKNRRCGHSAVRRKSRLAWVSSWRAPWLPSWLRSWSSCWWPGAVGLWCVLYRQSERETYFAKFLRKLPLCCAKERKESCANMVLPPTNFVTQTLVRVTPTRTADHRASCARALAGSISTP